MFLQRLKLKIETRKLALELQQVHLEAMLFNNADPDVEVQFDVIEKINDEIQFLEGILAEFPDNL